MYTFVKDILRERSSPLQRSIGTTQPCFRDITKLAPNTPWFAYKAALDVAELKSEKSRLEREHARVLSELREQQTRSAALDDFGNTLVVGLESRLAAFETQVSELTDELDITHDNLATEQRRALSLLDERDILQAKIHALSTELSSIHASLQMAQAEGEAHRRMAANMSAAISADHRTCSKLRSSLSSAQGQVEQMQERIHQFEESQFLAVQDLEAAREALHQVTLQHSAAETKSTDLQHQFDTLSDTLSGVQKEKVGLEVALAEALVRAEAAVLSAQELRTALASEQDRCRGLEADLKRANVLLFAADRRTIFLQAEIDALKRPTVLFDASAFYDSQTSSLDVSGLAIQVENELSEDEVVSHPAAEASLATQLETALSAVARPKAREGELLTENSTLKSQLRDELQTRNGAIFDVQDILDEPSSLSAENHNLKTLLGAAEDALASVQVCADSLRLERDHALQQIEDQRQHFEQELRTKAEEEEKVHFVIAELNREKRELGTSKKSVEDALQVKVRRCEELEKEISKLTSNRGAQPSSLPTTPRLATPQHKSTLTNKENLSMSSRLFSRISSMRRQNTLPLSSSTHFNTPVNSIYIPDSPSPVMMHDLASVSNC